MQFLLHLDSPEINFSRAKVMRRSMTEAETIMWTHLRNRKLSGCKFRRQHPIGHYIADFYCHERRCMIEVDGPIHAKANNAEKDANRTAELDRMGITIFRVTNIEVLENPEKVLTEIQAFLNSLPSP